MRREFARSARRADIHLHELKEGDRQVIVVVRTATPCS